MSDRRASPFATAFLWAAAMTTSCGLIDTFGFNKQPDATVNDMAIAAATAAAVGFSERRDALKPS